MQSVLDRLNSRLDRVRYAIRFGTNGDHAIRSPTNGSIPNTAQAWEEMLDRLPAVFLSLDTDWRITNLNEKSRQQICEMLDEDLTKGKLMGEQFWELHPIDPTEATLYHSCHEAMDRREVVSHVERYDEGGETWIHTEVYPSETGVSIFSRDITTRKKKEQELQRQNERLEEFATIVSHDLRNPLNVANGYLELVRETTESSHLDHVAQALDRMSMMIEDLLELAREGARVKEPTWIDLEDVVADCWRNFDTGAATLQLAENRTIYADRNQLTQLFENVFRNAVEHAGSDIEVGIGPLKGGFFVEDDGSGLEPEERDKVFEPGYSTSEDGTGFGLRIVEGIAAAHEWNVVATESAVGGARFEFTGVIDAAIGTNPDPNVFSGTSTRSERTASGEYADDSLATEDNGVAAEHDGYPDHSYCLEIHADDADTTTDYYFEIEEGSHILAVTESVVDDRNATIDHTRFWVNEDGTRAAGRIQPGDRNAYRFSTTLCDLTVDGPAVAYVDGGESNLEHYPLDSATGEHWKGGFPWHESDKQHIYEFHADDDSTYSDYYFEIEDGSTITPVIESEVDEVEPVANGEFYWISEDGTRAAGRVHAGERNAYRFDTMLCDVTVDGPAVAYVNMQKSNLDRYPRECATGDHWKGGFPWQGQHRFEIRADTATTDTDYYIEIESGPMQPVPENGATVDLERQWVSRNGTMAAGRVLAGDRHAFRFDADMCDVTIDGEALPYINGTESSLGWFPQPGAAGDGWKRGFPWQQ